jgi:subtilisin family serine protease
MPLHAVHLHANQRWFGVLWIVMATITGNASVPPRVVPPPPTPRYLLAQPRPDTDRTLIHAFCLAHGDLRVREFPGLGFLTVIEPGPESTPEGALARYNNSGLFTYVEPDQPVVLATVPDDPFFIDGQQWALRNEGQDNGLSGADIRAVDGWALTHSASNVVVAIVDSGIRSSHKDLIGNLWRHPTTGAHGWNAVNGTDDSSDDQGHGTQLAGIVGARGNNGIGIAGVAWQVQIMACKFVDRFGNGTLSDAIACIEYARANGAHIINASWGIEEFSHSLSNAVQLAGQQGIVVVAAAGNRSSDTDIHPYYPASLPSDHVVAVAATTRNDELFGLSNYGAHSVHLGAPGFEIITTDRRSDEAYATRFGTSMSAAFVSGAMALIRARFPDETSQDWISRLLRGTDPLPSLADRSISGGRLNLANALAPSGPQLSIQLPSRGGFILIQGVGRAGAGVVLETSNLMDSWTPMLTNPPSASGRFSLSIPLEDSEPARFFRAVQTEGSSLAR